MAESKESKAARKSLMDSFATMDAGTKTDLFARVTAINEERDNYLNQQVDALATEAYLQEKFGMTAGTPKMDFIRSLSVEDKSDIIIEYNINDILFRGKNPHKAKLKDIEHRKRENKLRYKEDALELIGMYENALNENGKKIQTLEADIARTKSAIESAEAKLQEIIAKDDEALAYAGRQSSKFDKDKAIKEMNKNLDTLRKKLEKQESLLTELKDIQQVFKKEFDKRKAEIETVLQAENIYIYGRSDKPETPKENGDSSIDEKSITQENGSGLQGKSIRARDRETSKIMMEDFINLSPEKQRDLIDSMDNQGILDMVRKSGPLNRLRFRAILNARLDELSENQVTFDGQLITKDELKAMRKMEPGKLKAIRKELDEFNEDFMKKNPDQILDFEKRLQYARIGALLAEADGSMFGAFKGIRRFFEGFSQKGNSIFELSKSFADYAEVKCKRREQEAKKKNEQREILGREKVPELGQKTTQQLNRNPQNRSRFQQKSSSDIDNIREK